MSWQIVAASLSHAQWLNQVVEWAHQGGWLVTAMHDSRQQHWGTDTGWPDVFMVRGGRAIAAELKTGSGRTRRDQRAWLAGLQAAGIETHVWYPADADEVRRILLDGVPLRKIVMRATIAKSLRKDSPKR